MILALLTRYCARRLSNHGHSLQHDRILAKAREIRSELNLSPDRRLET